MVMFKMRKYLNSQAGETAADARPEDPNLPLPGEKQQRSPVAPSKFDFFERIGGAVRDAAMAQFGKRGHASGMSLGFPSPGPSFGPTVLSALGFKGAATEKALSDHDREDKLALGQRPVIDRGKSEGDQTALTSAPDKQEVAWRSLGAGFGYDIDEQGLDAAQIEEDLRSNPSNDADTSEVEEYEQDDASIRSLKVNQQLPRSAMGKPDPYLEDDEFDEDMSQGDEDLGAFSNPSDEDAALQGRQHQRKSRRDGLGMRKRATPAITLPSSSLGETDYEHPPGQSPGQHRRAKLEDLLSNPSDESQDIEQGVFGAFEKSEELQAGGTAMLAGALGHQRQSTIPSLNPAATPFQFRASPSALNSAPADGSANGHRFRPPSVPRSSFDGSAFGVSRHEARRKSLSATAPSFTPGANAFTFQAPGGAPKPILFQSPTDLKNGHQDDEVFDVDGRLGRGRDKRQRFAGFQQQTEDVAIHGTNAKAPTTSASREMPNADTSSLMPAWAQAPQTETRARLGAPGFDENVARRWSGVSNALFTLPASQSISIKRSDAPAYSEADDTAVSGLKVTHTQFRMPGLPPPPSDFRPGSATLHQVREEPSPRQPLRHRPRDASISLSEVPNCAEDTDDVESELKDIIEELAERLDKSLAIWSDKLIDEMHKLTNKTMAAPSSRYAEHAQLIQSVEACVSTLLDKFASKASTSLRPVGLTAPAGSQGEDLASPEHRSTLANRDEDLDFDYVEEVLESKMDVLKTHLDRTLLEWSETVAKKVAAPSGIAVDMSSDSLARLADTLGFRIRAALDGLSGTLRDVLHEELQHSSVDVTLQELSRKQGETASLVQDSVANVLDSMQEGFQKIQVFVQDARVAVADRMEMSVVNAITPQLESLRQDQIDLDILAARVTTCLLPIIDRKIDVSADVVRDIVDALADRLSYLKEGDVVRRDLPTPSQEQDLEGSIARALRDHALDLEPVVALLEPLMAKQEDARTLVRQVLTQQSAMECSFAALPDSLNAKNEILLAITQQMHDDQRKVQSKLDLIAEEFDSSQIRLEHLEVERETLLQQLEQGHQALLCHKDDLHEARADLSAANSYTATLKDQVRRLETEQEAAEKAATEAAAQVTDLRSRQRDAHEAQHAAERRADEANHRANVTEQDLSTTRSSLAAMQERLHDALSSLSAERESSAREREAAAQANAELLSRVEKAEQAMQAATAQAAHVASQANARENELQESLASHVARAVRAEGELSSMREHATEQDAQIERLQHVLATQEQQLADNLQKLAEAQTSAARAEQLTEALAAAELRATHEATSEAERESLASQLRTSQETEMVSLVRTRKTSIMSLTTVARSASAPNLPGTTPSSSSWASPSLSTKSLRSVMPSWKLPMRN